MFVTSVEGKIAGVIYSFLQFYGAPKGNKYHRGHHMGIQPAIIIYRGCYYRGSTVCIYEK